MIPKIIHLCWISGDPYPPLIDKCIRSWKAVLPDYEVVVWDYDKVMSLGYKWIRQAVEEKKYAFAADCVRFYALWGLLIILDLLVFGLSGCRSPVRAILSTRCKDMHLSFI